MEAFRAAERRTGRAMRYEYVDQNRAGDHICYISNLEKMRTHYPEWDIRVSLDGILDEIVEGWRERLGVE